MGGDFFVGVRRLNDICGEYAVSGASGTEGKLTVTREGMFYIFEAELEPGCEPAALYVECGGRRMKAGSILAGRMKKRLSAKTLAEAGIERIDAVFAADPDAEREAAGKWRLCEDPSALFSDPDTAESCRGVSGALVSEAEGGVTRLAVPLEFGKPFLPLSVFSLGTWTRLNGRGYLVFALRDGRPVV